jgi:hypothetical protein
MPNLTARRKNEVSSSLAVQSRSSGLCFFVNLSHSLPGVQ